MRPSGKTGPLDLTVRIVGYKSHVLHMLGMSVQPSLVSIPVQTTREEEEDMNDRLASTIDLILVDDVKIASQGQSLFNHPKNKVILVFYLFFLLILLPYNVLVNLVTS